MFGGLCFCLIKGFQYHHENKEYIYVTMRSRLIYATTFSRLINSKIQKFIHRINYYWSNQTIVKVIATKKVEMETTRVRGEREVGPTGTNVRHRYLRGHQHITTLDLDSHFASLTWHEGIFFMHTFPSFSFRVAFLSGCVNTY